MRRRIPPNWAILAVAVIGFSTVGEIVDGAVDRPDPLSAPAIQEVLERVITWQLRHPKHELWEWPNGVFYAGVMAVYQVYGQQSHLHAMTRGDVRFAMGGSLIRVRPPGVLSRK